MITPIREEERQVSTNTEKDLYTWIDTLNSDLNSVKTLINNLGCGLHDLDMRLRTLEGAKK